MPADPIKIISPQELTALREATPKVVVLDANPREVYDEGHVPGAHWMATDGDGLPADRATPVVFYCYNPVCGASHSAAKAAVAGGWTDVSRMSAGIMGWKAAGLPVEK